MKLRIYVELQDMNRRRELRKEDKQMLFYYDNWHDGNIPKLYDKSINGFYWVMISDEGCLQMYPQPVIYSRGGRWVGSNGEELVKDKIVSYYPICYPKKYGLIGNGKGFYIKTYCRDEVLFLGPGRCNIQSNQNSCGYISLPSAILGLKRCVNHDVSNNIHRKMYHVVDGNGEVLYTYGEDDVRG